MNKSWVDPFFIVKDTWAICFLSFNYFENWIFSINERLILPKWQIKKSIGTICYGMNFLILSWTKRINDNIVLFFFLRFFFKRSIYLSESIGYTPLTLSLDEESNDALLLQLVPNTIESDENTLKSSKGNLTSLIHIQMFDCIFQLDKFSLNMHY